MTTIETAPKGNLTNEPLLLKLLRENLAEDLADRIATTPADTTDGVVEVPAIMIAGFAIHPGLTGTERGPEFGYGWKVTHPGTGMCAPAMDLLPTIVFLGAMLGSGVPWGRYDKLGAEGSAQMQADIENDPEIAAAFKRINAAYRTLCDLF